MADLALVLSDLERIFEQSLRRFNTPGLVVCITNGEKLLRTFTLGYADMATGAILTPDTAFQIGSIGKSLTSLAALTMQDQGDLDINAPVNDYLPWLKLRSPGEPIRVRHLMSHTAGLPMGTDATTSAIAEGWTLRGFESEIPPGSHFHYSNTGYKLLGLILEQVGGRPVDEVLQRRVLDPLGMNDTDAAITYSTRERSAVGYQPFYPDRPLGRSGLLAPAPWVVGNTADGSIASTAGDMAVYMRMLLNAGQGVLSRATFSLLVKEVILREGRQAEEYYGHGLTISRRGGHTRIGHGGGAVGFRADMRLDMNDGLGVTILTNGPWDPGDWTTFILDRLGAAIRGQEVDISPPPDPFLVLGAEEYAGRYVGDEAEFTIVAEGDRLNLGVGGRQIPLERQGPDEFFADHPEYDRFRFRFGRQDGIVVEACHGSSWCRNDRYRGPASFTYPADWDAFGGHYASHDPWFPTFRIVSRKGELWLVMPSGAEESLEPLGEDEFRVGRSPHSPERLQMGMFTDGRPHEARLSGAAYHRSFIA